MKTTNEFVEYCKTNNTGTGFNEKWLNKHFAVIEKNLMNGEEGKVAFVGLKDYESVTKHDGNFAYLITDKRIIIAQKKLIGESVVTVSLKNINDISMSTGAIFTSVVFDTIREKFGVGVAKEQGRNIFNLVHEELDI